MIQAKEESIEEVLERHHRSTDQQSAPSPAKTSQENAIKPVAVTPFGMTDKKAEQLIYTAKSISTALWIGLVIFPVVGAVGAFLLSATH